MGTPGEMADDEVSADDGAPPVPGMLRTTPEQAAAAAADRAAAALAVSAADAAISPGRMKELKDKARAEIEQRLKERRKKRRLLRGGDVSGGFTVS